MKATNLDDYSVIREGAVVLALGVPFRRGRSPVAKVRASGFGDLQWTCRDGVVESIGSTQHPVPDDVMARFAGAGVQLVEFDGDPVTEQNLAMSASR